MTDLVPASIGKCLRCGHEISCPFCPAPWCHTCTDCSCYNDNDCELPPGIYESWAREVHRVMERLNINRWPPLLVSVISANDKHVTVEYDGEPEATDILPWSELRSRSVTTSTEDLDRYHADAYNRALQQAEDLLHNQQ